MTSCTPIHRSSEPLGLHVSNLCRPVSAEAAAHNSDTLAIDIVASFQIVDGCRKGPFGARLLPETWVLAGAGHIDGEGRQSFFVKHFTIGHPVFFPTIDAAPVHHHRGTIDAPRDLQIANDFFALERNLDALQWWIE